MLTFLVVHGMATLFCFGLGVWGVISDHKNSYRSNK